MKCFVLCQILVALFSLSCQAQVLSLEEARHLAAEEAESVRLQRLGLDQARSSLVSSEAARLPRLDLTASLAHVSETGGISFAIPGLLQRSITFGDGNTAEAALTVSAPLFTGFRLRSRRDIALDQVHIAEWSLRGSAMEASHEAERAYRRAQAADIALQILDDQQRLVQSLLEQRIALLQEGQAIPLDTVLLTTRLLRISVDRLGAANQRDDALAVLEQLCRLPAGIRVQPFTPGPVRHLPPLDSLLALARISRADLQSLKTARTMAEHGVTAARSSIFPSLSVSASMRAGRPGVDQVQNSWMTWWTAGLRLDWNLWAWGEDRAKVEQQSLEMDKASLRLEQSLSRVRTAVTTLLRALELRRQSIELLGRTVLQEQERLSITSARLGEGQGVGSELVDAETSLGAARLSLEQSRVEYTILLEELAWVVGVPSQYFTLP